MSECRHLRALSFCCTGVSLHIIQKQKLVVVVVVDFWRRGSFRFPFQLVQYFLIIKMYIHLLRSIIIIITFAYVLSRLSYRFFEMFLKDYKSAPENGRMKSRVKRIVLKKYLEKYLSFSLWPTWEKMNECVMHESFKIYSWPRCLFCKHVSNFFSWLTPWFPIFSTSANFHFQVFWNVGHWMCLPNIFLGKMLKSNPL